MTHQETSNASASFTEPRRRPQFTIRHLLVATGLASGAFALLRLGGPGLLLLVMLGSSIVTFLWALWTRRRRLALGSGLFCAAIILFGLATSQEARGSGYTTQPIRIVVVSAANGTPLSGASVRIREVSDNSFSQAGIPQTPIPAHEKGISATTDGRGATSLTWRFRCGFRDSFWRHDGHVYVGLQYWIQVEATDHKLLLVPLSSVIGESYDYYKLTYPPARIEMKRQAALSSRQPPP